MNSFDAGWPRRLRRALKNGELDEAHFVLLKELSTGEVFIGRGHSDSGQARKLHDLGLAEIIDEAGMMPSYVATTLGLEVLQAFQETINGVSHA